MDAPRLFAFIAFVLAASACSTTLNPGRCNQTPDCPTGQICNLAPTVQGDGRCVLPGSLDGGGTGGSGGAGGADASVDGGGGDVNTCTACGGNTPVCLQGSCVECAASSDCNADPTKPICDPTAHTCVACSNDAQCAAKLGPTGNPGICMSHLDGHCATDAETIYVQNTSGCMAAYVNDSGGTASAPYCSMDPVGLAANDTHTLVVIRGAVSGGSWTYQRGAGHPETSFIGQQSAVVASATSPGFSMSSGSAYIRGVKFSPSATVCISATGGTLDLDTVVVDSCQGGGVYLDGAAFTIMNSTVTNNGPGQNGAITWGGILVNALPVTGPTVLSLDTIQANKGPGLECAGQITGSGVFALGNSTADIGGTCGVTSCAAMGAGCGAP
jgi:hypothetical protein